MEFEPETPSAYACVECGPRDLFVEMLSLLLHWRATGLPYLKKINILKLDELHKFLVQQFMYKYSHNLLPGPFVNYFTLSHNVHYYNTRQ